MKMIVLEGGARSGSCIPPPYFYKSEELAPSSPTIHYRLPSQLPSS